WTRASPASGRPRRLRAPGPTRWCGSSNTCRPPWTPPPARRARGTCRTRAAHPPRGARVGRRTNASAVGSYEGEGVGLRHGHSLCGDETLRGVKGTVGQMTVTARKAGRPPGRETTEGRHTHHGLEDEASRGFAPAPYEPSHMPALGKTLSCDMASDESPPGGVEGPRR